MKKRATIICYPAGDIVVQDSLNGDRVVHISFNPGDSLVTNFAIALRLAIGYEYGDSHYDDKC